jgi:hypothetical protein
VTPTFLAGAIAGAAVTLGGSLVFGIALGCLLARRERTYQRARQASLADRQREAVRQFVGRLQPPRRNSELPLMDQLARAAVDRALLSGLCGFAQEAAVPL